MASSTFKCISSKEQQNALYTQCLQGPPNALYYQDDLRKFNVVPGNLLLDCVQGLMDDGLITLHAHDGLMAWKVVKREDAAREKSLSMEESLILSHIKDAQSEGIWTKHLGRKVNLHTSVMTGALKKLESKNFIKAVNNVRWPNRKIYMIASLTPSEDVTGGPWYTDGELDVHFIEELARFTHMYLTARSWVVKGASAPPKRKMNKAEAERVRAKALEPWKHLPSEKKDLLPLPPGFRKYPDVSELTMFINRSGITPVTLAEVDITQLLDTMCYDGQLDKIVRAGSNEIRYKARRDAHPEPTKDVRTGLTESPCGICPVFNLCEEGGPVNPSNCEYFETWLNF